MTPAAADPVSVGVATALPAWAVGVAAYSSAGSAITTARGQQLLSSATTYADQETANASLLGGAGGSGAVNPAPFPPAVALPMVPPVSPPVSGAPPGSGREIAELLHAGPGPAGLHSAAQQLRSHATQLDQSARGLNGAAAQVSSDWNSESGTQGNGADVVDNYLEWEKWSLRVGFDAAGPPPTYLRIRRYVRPPFGRRCNSLVTGRANSHHERPGLAGIATTTSFRGVWCARVVVIGESSCRRCPTMTINHFRLPGACRRPR